MIRYRVENHPEIPGWHRITIDAPVTEPIAEYEGGNACEALLQFCLKYVRDSTGESFRMSCPKGWHHEETDTQTNVTYYRRGSVKVGVGVKPGMLMLSVSDRAMTRARRADMDRVRRDFVPEGAAAVEAESPNRTNVRFICVARPGHRLDTSGPFPVAVPIEAADA